MARQKKVNGGGSGGGPATSGNHVQTFDGGYAVSAHQIEIATVPAIPPLPPSPSLITILAAGMAEDGTVDIRGDKGVRITAGPAPLPPQSSESTNGLEIAVGDLQSVTIERGLIPGIDQKIEMAPGSITVDAGVGSVTIKSLTQITLSVAGGMSTITLGPQGITIQGLMVQIN